MAIVLLIILEGTLYDVIINIRSKRNQESVEENRKPAENGKPTENEKPIENGNSYPENKYKLRAENGDIQHTQPVDKHAQKPGNASLPVCRL